MLAKEGTLLYFRRRFYQERWKIASIFPHLPLCLPKQIQHPSENLSECLPHFSGLLPTSVPLMSTVPQPSVPRRPPPHWEQQMSIWLSLGESLLWLLLQLQKTSWSDGFWHRELGAEQAAKWKVSLHLLNSLSNRCQRLPASYAGCHQPASCAAAAASVRDRDAFRGRFTPRPRYHVKALWTFSLMWICEGKSVLAHPTAVNYLLGVSVRRKETE